MKETLRFAFFLCIFASIAMLFAPDVASAQSSAEEPTRKDESRNCERFWVIADLDVVKAGEIVTFSVVSENPEIQAGEFEWTISEGQIVSGQGTSTLMVQTTEEMLSKPVKQPAPGPNGYISGFPRRVSILATATINAGSQSGCPQTSNRVSVNRYRSIAANKPADMTALELSSNQLALPCSEEIVPKASTSDSMIIDVTASAHDHENDVITYHYTISGGRIIGVGANIKWDLNDVAPGYYTITGGVDDGCGICGKTISKSVTVLGC